MSTDLEQNTTEFVHLFYEGEGKTPNYLSKQAGDLRKLIENYVEGSKRTPLHKSYSIWASMSDHIAPAAPPADAELVAKAERFKKQRDNMEKKLVVSQEGVSDLRHRNEYLKEDLEVWKADYKSKCAECDLFELHLKDRGMTKDHLEQFQRYKQVYIKCQCKHQKMEHLA